MATAQQQFINSCTSGEVYKVESILQKGGVEVSLADSRGFTPLHLTIGSKQSEIAVMLINAGANVNSITLKDAYTPLHVAASSGLADIIPLLIKSGAKIEQRDGMGNTPLLVACESPENNTSQCAIVLLQNGAELDVENKVKRNAPLLAAKAGKQALYQQLKDNGAKVSAKDSMGVSAEDYEKNW